MMREPPGQLASVFHGAGRVYVSGIPRSRLWHMLRQCRLAFNAIMVAGVSFRQASRDREPSALAAVEGAG